MESSKISSRTSEEYNQCNGNFPNVLGTCTIDQESTDIIQSPKTNYGSVAKSGDTYKIEIVKQKQFRFRNLSRRQKAVLMLCCVTFFLEGVAFSVIAPFFPIEAKRKGMSLSLTGFVFGEFQLVMVFLSPLFGANMGRLGPKFVIMSGVFLAGASTLLLGVLDRCPQGNPFIILAFMCRTIEAIGFTAYFTAVISFLTIEFPDDVSTAYGIANTANGIGMMIGPVLGGALYELGGYELPFFITGSFIWLNMILLWFLTPTIAGISDKKTKRSQLSMLRNPTVLIALMATVVASSARNFYIPILSPHLKSLGLSEGIIGLVFVVPMLVYTVNCPLWGFLTDKRYLVLELIVLGHFLYGVGYLLVGPSNLLPFLPTSLWIMIIGLVLLGVAACVVTPLFKLMQIGAIAAGFEKDSFETSTMISGLLSTGYSLGAFIGTMMAGATADAYGYANAFTAIGITNIVMTLIVIAYFLIKRKQICEFVKL